MAIQTANPGVAAKIKRQEAGDGDDAWHRFDALLEQLDQVPDIERPFDPLEWDELGLPR